MTPILLTQIGEALYGASFRPQLAAALGVSPRTLRRWCAGTDPVPEGIVFDLETMLISRQLSVKLLLRALAT